jgi:hypothetical protein
MQNQLNQKPKKKTPIELANDRWLNRVKQGPSLNHPWKSIPQLRPKI